MIQRIILYLMDEKGQASMTYTGSSYLHDNVAVASENKVDP